MPHVPGMEKGDGAFEFCAQLIEFFARPGLELDEGWLVGVLCGDPLSVLRMEIPAPERVIAEKLHNEGFEELVVLCGWTEEERADEVEVSEIRIDGTVEVRLVRVHGGVLGEGRSGLRRGRNLQPVTL